MNVKNEYGKSDVIVDPLRAPLIQELFNLYATGTYSLSDLAKFSQKNNLTNNFYNRQETKPLSKNVIAVILKNPFYYGEMYVQKYDRFYRHKYEPIISKALFDECQRITGMRSHANNRAQAIQSSKKDFIFRSLIKCAVTGRTVSSDRKEAKRNKNTYLITWNPNNPSKKLYVPESDILDQVTGIFKSLAIPMPMLDEITTHLQQSHETEKEFHKHRIEDLRKQEDAIKLKMNRLLDIYLDKAISEDVYIGKNASLEQQLKTIRIDRQLHEEADGSFKKTLITAFRLANRASELFESSKMAEKRELINFVFSNLALRGKNLEYSLRKPFDMMVNFGNREEWLPGPDSNQRPIG